MSDIYVPYDYLHVPPVWSTHGADIMEIHLLYRHTNHVEKIDPPLRIGTFFDISIYFSLQLDTSKVVIIDPKSWQNINRLSNYQSKQNGYEILNVGRLIDYVYLRHEKTMKLLEIIYGKNCGTIKLSSVYNIESNCFRISVINGNLRIIIIAGVKYLIFRFLIPYLNTNANKFEPLFCVCVENRPNERQYWQCMNIFTTQELIQHFRSVIAKTRANINGIYNKNTNNNTNNNNNEVSLHIIKQFFLPPANKCVYKIFYGNLPIVYFPNFNHENGKRLYQLLSAIKGCLKCKNNNKYYKLNKHLLEELENIFNTNNAHGMSVDDLIQLIYNGIAKSVSMAIEYGVVATQKYIDKRGRIYFELILLLEIETQAGIYQFGLALIENKMGNGNNSINNNNNNNNFPIDENGHQIYGYDIAAILTGKMTRDNVSQNNGILCYHYHEYERDKYIIIPCPCFVDYMKNKYPDGDIIHYWPLDMRRGPRKTSFLAKVKQQRQEQMLKQRQAQALNRAKAQNAQINNNNNNNTIVVQKNVKHNTNVSVNGNISNIKNTSARVAISAHEIRESTKRKLRRQAATGDLTLILCKIAMILCGVYSHHDQASLFLKENMNNEEKNDNGGISGTDNENKIFDDICGMIDCLVDKNISIESKIYLFWSVYLAIVNKFKTNENEGVMNIVIEQLKIISKETKNLSHLKAQFEIKAFRRMWQLCDKKYAKLNENNNDNNNNGICFTGNSNCDLLMTKSGLNKPQNREITKAPNADI